MLNENALNTIFKEARTHSSWQDKNIEDSVLKEIYDLSKMGPTSANCMPMRVVFIKTKTEKEKLKQCLAEGNIDKTMSSPVTAIIAQDMEFYEKLPKLFPHTDAKSWFVGKQDYIEETAFRNSSIQGGYFIIAARSLGLDVGPMSGFDRKKCDELFFTGTKIRSNFLCNLGYGIKEKLYPRGPRLSFDEACKII